METLVRNKTCTGECPGCPVKSLGRKGVEAVGETVDAFDASHTSPLSDGFDEVLASHAAEASVLKGIDGSVHTEDLVDVPVIVSAPLIAAAAERVIMNQCVVTPHTGEM
jgi:hypothetical protein